MIAMCERVEQLLVHGCGLATNYSVLVHVRYAYHRHQLLEEKQMSSEVSDTFDRNTFWLFSFQLWCSVQTISFYLLLGINRQCLPQWMRVVVTLLPCLFLAHSTSALPPLYLITLPSICVYRACHRRQRPTHTTAANCVIGYVTQNREDYL